jgi:hypothetical protein
VNLNELAKEVSKIEGGKTSLSIAQIKEVLDTAGKHPVIPFAFGCLMGHLFWPQKGN